MWAASDIALPGYPRPTRPINPEKIGVNLLSPAAVACIYYQIGSPTRRLAQMKIVETTEIAPTCHAGYKLVETAEVAPTCHNLSLVETTEVAPTCH